MRATGKTITYAGFLKAYEESHDEEESEQDRNFPPLSPGDSLRCLNAPEMAEKRPSRPTGSPKAH